MQLNVDGVQAKLFEWAFEFNLIGEQGDFLSLESVNDFGSPDASVEVAFIIGVGLDRNALPSDQISLLLDTGQASLFDFFELGSMLVHHSLVVIRRDSSQSLREQVVVCKTWLHLHDVPLASQVVNRLDQQKFDTAIGSFRQSQQTGLAMSHLFSSFVL